MIIQAQRLGFLIAAVGAVYLVIVGWLSSWWYVPALVELGRWTPAAFGGTPFFITWGISGVLGAVILALGVAMCANAGAIRSLLIASGGTLLLVWLALWSATAHNPVVYGVGGGLILLFFLAFCIEWAGTRRRLEGAAKSAADLRLAASTSYFMSAWGLCGLLGAPTFLLRPELAGPHGSVPPGSTLAVKVLVCMVLGMGFTAAAQWIERRDRERTR